MKIKIILLLFLFFNSNNIYSQKAKQIDYFKTLTLNISDLQDYMLGFDFEFNGTKSDELGETYGWTYKRSLYDATKAYCFYNLYLDKDSSKSISFQSQIKEDYIRFKATIKDKGLKFIKTKNESGKLIEYYLNQKFESRIWIYVDNGITCYEMNLENLQ